MSIATSHQWRFAACAVLAFLLPACEAGGNFTLFGYTTKPNYDDKIHTIRVPIFKNKTFIRGIEFDLTQAVIREIEEKTPYKVVGPNSNADTELTGTITVFTKGLLNVNQLNEVREAETTLSAEVVWRNLRTGEYLTKPVRRPGDAQQPVLQAPMLLAQAGVITPPTAPQGVEIPTTPETPNGTQMPPAGGPGVVPPPVTNDPNKPPPAPPGVVVKSDTSYIPEVGQSTKTSLQVNVNSLAVQIVSMMEKPW